jgi:dihydroxyacid dehydratase/phosphogluconate dehydratase
MDAKTNIKARLPSRHVTAGPARAPYPSYYYAMGLTTEQIHQPFVGVATAQKCEIECTLFDVREVFKKTPYIADLKPGGRYVAKDMFEVGGIPLLMKTLHGDCMTVTGRTIAENLKSVKWNPNQDVVGPAVNGAIKAEKVSYADA